MKSDGERLRPDEDDLLALSLSSKPPAPEPDQGQSQGGREMNTIPEETYIVVKKSDLIPTGVEGGAPLLIVRPGAILGTVDIGNVGDAVEVVEDFIALGEMARDQTIDDYLYEHSDQCPMCGQKKPEATGREPEN